MRSSGAMTSLTIDSFRQPIRKSRVFLHRVRLGLSLNIAIVAGHTSVSDLATEARMIRAVISGTHRQIATVLGVPGDGKLYQLSSFRPTDVAASVIAGADSVINPSLEDVGRDPVKTGLMPLYVRTAV